MSDIAHVREVIRAVNDCWLNGWYDQLAQYFDEHVVLALPGFADRIEGRRALVASYRDFGEKATIRRFEPLPPMIQLRGDAAVATCGFSIAYEIGGRAYEEKGTDLLVFARADCRWTIIWRTVVTAHAATAVQT